MRIDLNVTPFELGFNNAVQGLSSGIIVVALTLVTFVGMPREKMPEATAVYHLVRNIGASLFISICVAEVVRSTGMNYSMLSELVSPYNRTLAMPWVIGPLDTSSPACSRAPLARDLPPGRHDRASQCIRHLQRRRRGIHPARAAVAEFP